MAAATNSLKTRDFTGRRTVAGLFNDRTQAQQAISDLKAAGFAEDQIGVAMRDTNAQGQLANDSGVQGNHAGSGAVTGGVIGGVLGILVGIGALAIPGIGPVITAGVLSQAIGAGAAGLAIGAVGGGIVGALIGLGIPDEEAHHFESGFNAGGILVTVNAGPRSAEAVQILERDGGDTGASLYGAPRMDDMASGAYAAPAFGTTAANYADNNRAPQNNQPDNQNVQLREEVLSAQKDQVQAGEVTLRKEVVTETRNIDVPVTHEEVVIERHAVRSGEPAPNANFDTDGETIRVPVMAEQVNVTKTPVVTEEISLGKRQVQETQHVSGTVRREEATIDNPDNVDVLDRDTAKPGRS